MPNKLNPDDWELTYDFKGDRKEVIELATRLCVTWPKNQRRMPGLKKSLIFNMPNCYLKIMKRPVVPSYDKRLYHVQIYKRTTLVAPVLTDSEIRNTLLELYECKEDVTNRLENIHDRMYYAYLDSLDEVNANFMLWGRAGNVSKFKPYTWKKIPSIINREVTNNIHANIDVLDEFNRFADMLTNPIKKY